MNVYDKTYELANALRESNQHKEYKKLKNLVYSNSKNKQMIKDFKKKELELQADQIANKEPDKEKIEQLQQLYNILIANPDVGKYFEAEFQFERMISDIYKILGEAIDVDQELINVGEV